MTITKSVTLTATSKTEDGAAIMTYRASINTDDPENISYTATVVNQSLYRINRAQCALDREAFEDELYAEQDAMIAGMEGTEQ